MKRFLGIIMCCVFVVSMFLTGCGSQEEKTGDTKKSETNVAEDKKTESEEKRTLSIMIWDKEEVIKEVLVMFKEKYPNVEVEVSYTDNKQYDNVLNTKLATGEGPDIFEVGANVKNLAAAQRTMDLSNEEFVSKYHESGLEPFMYEGKNYAVPWMSWMEGIFYNKDLFKQAGITEVPKTWDEFLDIHEKLKEAGIKPQAMGAKSWEPMMKQSMAVVISGFYPNNKDFGEKFSDGEANMKGNWDEYIAKWAEIVERGYLTPEMLGMDYEQAQEEFAMGNAAMWESGNWAINSIKEKNPDLNFNFFPIPAIEGKGYLVGGPGSAWAVNSETKNPDLAKAFLEFWSTKEAQLAAQKGYGGGLFLKGVETPLDESMSGAQEALSEGRIFCPWNEWYSAQAIIIEYGKAMQEYLSTTGEKDVLNTLDRADQKRDEVLETKR